MPGKWQVAVLSALAQQSPLALQAIHAHCGATTHVQRSSCKRAVWELLQQGLVVRPRRGVYALMVDVEALIRAHWPKTERWKKGKVCARVRS